MPKCAVIDSCNIKICRQRNVCINDGKEITIIKTRAFQRYGKSAFIPCHYCGSSTPINHITRDHKVPKSKGGKGKDNILPACRTCNNEKADKGYFDYLRERRDAGRTMSLEARAALDQYLVMTTVSSNNVEVSSPSR